MSSTQKSGRSLTSNQGGFTIVELMIATLVFSVVLLVITIGVLSFTNSYYKGINSSTTQSTAQNAIDTVSQAIQFSSSGSAGTDVAPSGLFCAGSRMFLYSLGVQYKGATPSASNWGLYMFPNPHTSNCDTSGISSFAGGTELLASGMRVANVSVTNIDATKNLWQISLTLVYGDSDLLCNTKLGGTTKGSCQTTAPTYALSDPVSGDDVSCKSQIGSQFCSVAALSTVAQQRIAGD
jgi:prepilin-type N-terminal cleavage/methylation domain-containing protein